MAQFTVRVELRGATGAEYDVLHHKMFARGYRRFVMLNHAGTGVVKPFALPTAEYDHSSGQSVTDVRDEVVAIASSVRKGPWVLVTQVADRAIQSHVLTGANAA